MAVERAISDLNPPDYLENKSVKALYHDVIEAERSGKKLDMVDYLSAFLDAGGYKLRIEAGESPDPNRPLVLAVNHHSRQKFFTTEESLRIVAISSVSARLSGVTDKNIAWMIRELKIPPIGIGKMARKVQNATGPVFDSIPAKTIVKWSMKGFMPRLKEAMTKEDQLSVFSRTDHRIKNNFALGVLPEQEPGFELKPHHRNFERTLNSLKFISEDFNIQTLAAFYKGREARAVYGPVINVKRYSNVHQVAVDVTNGIAQGLPQKLKEAYIKSQLPR